MKNIHEAVDLPVAAEKPMVHPLDLSEARRPFVTAWWLGVVTLPTVFFAMASVLWAISNNYATPFLVPIALTIIAALVKRYLMSEAWAYIPRKRQDLLRPPPLSWQITQAAVSALALLVGILLLVGWMDARDFPAAVGAYTIGMGIGIGLIMALSLIWSLVAPARLRAAQGSWLTQLITLLVVLLALIYAYTTLSDTPGASTWQTGDLAVGAVIIIVVQLFWSAVRLLPSRRRHAPGS